MTMHNRKLQRFFYGLMFLLLAVAIYFFVVRLVTTNAPGWDSYSRVYIVLLLSYTWYIFILLYIEDKKTIVYPAYNNEKISVIMPCYNESPALLKRAISSVISAKGNKEIIIIDDGSTNEIRAGLLGLAEH